MKKMTFAKLATTVALFGVISIGCGDDPSTPTSSGGTAPNAPQNLRVSQVSPSSIRLDWRDASTNENGFEVMESINVDNAFRVAASVGANVDSVILIDHHPDSLYFFKVRSFNAGGNSVFTATVQFASGYLAKTFEPNGGPVTSIAFDPTGGFLVTGLGNFALMTWDVRTGGLTHTYNGHNQPVSQVQYLLNGNMILSRAANRGRVWPLQIGLQEYTFPAKKALFSPDGKYLAVEGDDGISLKDPANERLIIKLQSDGHLGAFSANGKYLACDTPFKLYDLTDTTTMRSPFIPEVAIEGSVYSLSPDGSLAAFDVGVNRLSVKIVRIPSMQLLYTLGGHSRAIKSGLFNSDASLFATGSDDRSIIIWDMTTGLAKRTLTGHDGVIYDIAWDPDGRYIASASGDMTAKLWGPLR